jgi:hypothetical protein
MVFDIPSPGFDAFRIVRSGVADDPVLLNSLRSHYELSEEPRKVERDSTVMHMGISMFFRMDAAVQTARRWPALGGFVATVKMQPGSGFNVAQTGQTQHLTAWADPIKLLAAISDIQPVA